MFPQIKLALIFTKMATQHGPKILHANNPDLLTRDLGDALKKQKDILSDPRKSAIITAYDVLPIIIEVKVLTLVTARQLGISTKGKSDIEVLQNIITASEARNGGQFSKDIKDTLEWTRKLFSHPDIQAVLSMEMTAIEMPRSPKAVLSFFAQLAGRCQDELSRVNEFLRQAKEVGGQLPDTKPAPRRGGKGG